MRTFATKLAATGIAMLLLAAAITALAFADLLYPFIPLLCWPLLAIASVGLAGWYLVCMCLPWQRDRAAIVLGAFWLPPLFALIGWFASPWLIGLIVAPALGLLAWERITRPRMEPDRCGYCGYDIRGLPPTAVCPECGRS